MRLGLIGLWTSTLLCAGISAAASDDPLTIVTLGDSITKGERSGVTADETFSALLEKQLNDAGRSVRVVNLGVGGERTDEALLRLDDVLTLKPDIVTVMYGTNDSYIDAGAAATRITLDAYRTNLTRIVTELLRRGIVPVLMTEPRHSDQSPPNGIGENPNVRLEPFVDACREVAAEWRVPLVDHYARWTTARADGVDLHTWTTDGCHPNPAGHCVLAETMLPVLQQALGPELAARQTLFAGKRLRVVCFGDSVTGVYYHTGSRRAYTDMLGIALRRIAPAATVEMINAGISGHSTRDALNRIDADVLERRPDLVTVMFGLNDMLGVPLDEYRSNLQTIVARCREVGAEVVLATPNNVINTEGRPTPRLVEFCDVVRQVGRDERVPVCDCYREFDAIRAQDALGWRVLMSDEIHPNMAGHKRMAEQLAEVIAGERVSLDDVPPFQPAISHTLALLRENKPVRVLAMAPFDTMIAGALRQIAPGATIEVTSWPTAGMSLADIQHDAERRVRSLAPDLVVLAVPRAAGSGSDEEFVNSYTWIMNWSLAYESPTWDCIVVHPSVVEGDAADRQRDELIRRSVRAQDLSLVDRSNDDGRRPDEVLRSWLEREFSEHAVDRRK